jgi:hypothetical protein
MKHIDTLCGQNAYCSNVKADGTCSDYCALEVFMETVFKVG